jgi:hypothetical protein
MSVRTGPASRYLGGSSLLPARCCASPTFSCSMPLSLSILPSGYRLGGFVSPPAASFSRPLTWLVALPRRTPGLQATTRCGSRSGRRAARQLPARRHRLRLGRHCGRRFAYHGDPCSFGVGESRRQRGTDASSLQGMGSAPCSVAASRSDTPRGMRPAEGPGLRIEDIDFERRRRESEKPAP